MNMDIKQHLEYILYSNEMTGYQHQAMNAIIELLGFCDYNRLCELAKADKDGRIVILPDKNKIPMLKSGTPVWYVNRENGEIEPGKVSNLSYKNETLDSFGVEFDYGDFDEFYGSAWGDCLFASEEQAKAALEKKPLTCAGCIYLDQMPAPCANCVRAKITADYYSGF